MRVRTIMSGNGRAQGELGVALLCLLTASGWVLAEEEPLPDAEFLEYLGSWQESDEDWLLFEDAVSNPAGNAVEERSDSVSEDEASPESKDEY